jgi:hypothetical protein
MVLFAFVPSAISSMEMSFVVLLQSIWLHVQLLALLVPLLAFEMVSFRPSSFFVPLHLCSFIPSSLFSLRLLLLQLCYFS